jgi:hypothetical protein
VVTGNNFGDLDSSNTVSVWRQNRVLPVSVGKYVNGCSRPNIWRTHARPRPLVVVVRGLPPDQAMYDYDLNRNRTIVRRTAPPTKGDVITNRALDFIDATPSAMPFFLTVGYTACSPPTRSTALVRRLRQRNRTNCAAGAFADVGLPSTPSMDEDGIGWPADVASLPSLTAGALRRAAAARAGWPPALRERRGGANRARPARRR